jgi:BirA family biotin operon repressor/biotin-[acetyl-CoA-carboxylase] ligase
VKAELEGALADRSGHWLGAEARVLSETTSTMDEGWKALEAGAAHGLVIVAEVQSAGRGSHGRAWESPPGDDLYLSALLRLDRPRPTLTLATALAVVDAARSVGVEPERVRVKWPNDVLIDGAKVAGILCESRSRGKRFDAVVGIGLNVNRERFDPALEATSLRLATGEPQERGAVLLALLNAMERWTLAEPSAVTSALEDVLAWRGEVVRCDALEGELLGVATDGGLRLRVDGSERVVHAGRLQR